MEYIAGEAGMVSGTWPWLLAVTGGRPMKRPTDRLPAPAMLAVGVARFAEPRDSGVGRRSGGRHGGGRGAYDR